MKKIILISLFFVCFIFLFILFTASRYKSSYSVAPNFYEQPEPSIEQTTPNSPTDDKNSKEINNICNSIEKIKMANIVFMCPEEMIFGENKSVKLILSLTKEEKEIINELMNSNKKLSSSNIRVSDKMEALLFGSSFNIINLTPSEQLIDSFGDTKWLWEITGKEDGIRTLYLTINMKVDFKDKEITKCVYSTEENINIKSNYILSFGKFLKENWKWGCSALAPVFVWLFTVWKKKRRKKVIKK